MPSCLASCLFFCFAILIACSQLGTQEGFNKYYMEKEYAGIVEKTQVNNRGASYRLVNGITFGWRGHMYPNYSHYIEKGDTCVKEKGTLVLAVYKTNGDTAFLDLSWEAVVKGDIDYRKSEK